MIHGQQSIEIIKLDGETQLDSPAMVFFNKSGKQPPCLFQEGILAAGAPQRRCSNLNDLPASKMKKFSKPKTAQFFSI